jgi:hypothetical protein
VKERFVNAETSFTQTKTMTNVGVCKRCTLKLGEDENYDAKKKKRFMFNTHERKKFNKMNVSKEKKHILLLISESSSYVGLSVLQLAHFRNRSKKEMFRVCRELLNEGKLFQTIDKFHYTHHPFLPLCSL